MFPCYIFYKSVSKNAFIELKINTMVSHQKKKESINNVTMKNRHFDKPKPD